MVSHHAFVIFLLLFSTAFLLQQQTVILQEKLARQTAFSDFLLQCSVELKIKCMLQLLFENQKQYMECYPIKLLYSQIRVL